MKRPSFIEGVAVALAMSTFGAAVFGVLTAMFAPSGVLRLLIAVISLAYVIYLLARSHEHVGRVTVVLIWLISSSLIWLLAPPLPLYVVVHVGMLWLVRSLYFHASALSALSDLGLQGLSVTAAIWAGIQSSSPFLSIWCFFLVQALFVAIPISWCRQITDKPTRSDTEERFEHAYRVAEAALRKFSSTH